MLIQYQQILIGFEFDLRWLVIPSGHQIKQLVIFILFYHFILFFQNDFRTLEFERCFDGTRK